MSQPPPDNRFLALRSAAQEATDFAMPDDAVRRFMNFAMPAGQSWRSPANWTWMREVVRQLVRADEAQAVAHRIAIGELEMYPAPEPGQQVVDARSGSSACRSPCWWSCYWA